MKNKKVIRKPFTYTFGELVDKLSILSKKDLFGLPGARNELDTVMKWLTDLGIEAYLILSIIRLTQANNDIWHLENELRNAAEGEMPLDEVGRRAIKIREHNKTRVRYTNELDTICGAYHVTEKVKHLSEDIYEKFYQNGSEKKAK
jgi:hypothetical protein